jgi:hypothetical protein
MTMRALCVRPTRNALASIRPFAWRGGGRGDDLQHDKRYVMLHGFSKRGEWNCVMVYV